jgi:putative peptidoglycan lipid II flippase
MLPPAEPAGAPSPRRGGASAAWVGLGIISSRLVGLVRQRVFAHYFGDSWIADAFSAALRLPNVTQNLLGEGTLSASFIPTYVGALSRGEAERARRFALATLGLLGTTVLAVSALGAIFAPVLTRVLVPGFSGEKLDLAIELVRWFFPMTGLLALSAWCLGVLNSHRRFFLPYFAPVLWSAAQIAALLVAGRWLGVAGAPLALVLGAAAVLGAALQLSIQLPSVRRLLGSLRPSADWGRPDVRQAATRLGPVVLGRGVVQLSSFLDTLLASLLPTGANAALGYIQTLYALPVSLFGVGEAAATLPEMARDGATVDRAERMRLLRGRLGESLTRVGFTTVPTTLAFALLADQWVGALYQTGRFDARATALVAPALAAYALGLLPNASVRIVASAFYALGDTRTPASYAIVRVVISGVLSFVLMQRFGVAGLCAGAAMAGWLEALALFFRVRRELEGLPLSFRRWGTFALSAVIASAAGLLGRGLLRGAPVLASAAVSLPLFGAVYLALCALMGAVEVREILAALGRRLGFTWPRQNGS